MFGEKKYRYLLVRFNNTSQMYTYRTDDSSISIGDVVIVPTPEGNKPALVIENKRYPISKVPYPIELTKSIIRKARLVERRAFGNAGKNTFYIEHEYMRGKLYECGLCNALYGDIQKICHHCNARWIKRKYDPTFIDEIEEYDAMFGK